jgi:hypothetical protein
MLLERKQFLDGYMSSGHGGNRGDATNLLYSNLPLARGDFPTPSRASLSTGRTALDKATVRIWASSWVRDFGFGLGLPLRPARRLRIQTMTQFVCGNTMTGEMTADPFTGHTNWVKL